MNNVIVLACTDSEVEKFSTIMKTYKSTRRAVIFSLMITGVRLITVMKQEQKFIDLENKIKGE